ncbi:hypothetical protein [Winogradskyella wichelsiae]|uniref:hypothetical protein n=1 Tax=Winogradskyella wichelsiae TaxID=2697007 RepID=UPI003EF5A552
MNEDSKVIVIALIILTLIIAGVQWLLIRFTHWSVALVISGFISFVISFLYVSLSNATPNGAGNTVNLSEYSTPTILIFSIFLCSFCLVGYLSKAQISKMAYVTSLSLIALMIIGLLVSYGINYYKDISFYNKTFSSCQIEIKTEEGVIPIISSISFKNEANSFTTNIELEINKDRNAIHSQNDLWSMPRFANKIKFQCISTKTGNLFYQEFPFNYSLCQEKKEGWLHQKSIMPIKIVLKTDKKIDLYINNRFIKQYLLNNKE